MEHTVISLDRLNAMLRTPYNPPTIRAEDEKRRFHDEYWNCHQAVKESLSTIGHPDSLGRGDFCLNEDWQLSRGISVQLTSKRMLGHELVPAVQRVLKGLPERYSVYIDHNLPDVQDVFLLVESDKVYICADGPDLVQRLGFRISSHSSGDPRDA